MNETNRSSMKDFARRAVLAGLSLVLVSGAMAGDRVAQLSRTEGKVTIARAGKSQVDEATQMGPRVRNGSVFPGDLVATEPGGSATMVFSDGSQIKLGEKTSLSVQQVDLSSMVKSGKKDKPIGRTIQVFAGDIWTNVVPNPQIATNFETPSGVAAIKGTTFTISVGGEKKP